MRFIKVILVFLILVSLTGCVSSDTSNEKIIKDVMKDSITAKIPTFTNINKDYYSFYLPFDVGRKGSDMVSNVLSYNNTIFLMCINVPNVIKDRYYSDNVKTDNQNATTSIDIEKYTGSYVDYSNVSTPYEISVYKINEDSFYIQLLTRYLSFGGVVNKTSMGPILEKMLTIARTVRVSYELVATDFSNREVVSSKATQAIDLFQQQLPDSGYIVDLLNPKNPFDDYGGKKGEKK